jgi:serine/threonine protein kinase
MFAPETILKDRYQLKKQLGKTAIGHQTWLAIDLQTDKRVIIKLLAFSPQMQWEELKLFEREAKVLASLNHPRIPSYKHYFVLEKNANSNLTLFALVQTYIVGTSLQELLEKKKIFSEKEAREIATDILKILIYLHELSPPVLHRDIKPSNLILTDNKKVYLVDFGAVQAQAAVSGVTFTVVGTSGYAPLEQFWGRAVPQSDLYALGATLIHLLTGIYPIDLPHQDYRIQFRDKVNLKAEFIDWLERITDLAVENRFSNAREALNNLKSNQKNQFLNIAQNNYRKLAQPRRSKIKLKKSEHQLEILIPAGGIKRLGVIEPLSLFLLTVMFVLIGLTLIYVIYDLVRFFKLRSISEIISTFSVGFLLLFFVSIYLVPLLKLTLKNFY